MKIALVHDYLLEAGGAERVLRVLADMYPEAPIYTALTKHGTAKKLFDDPPDGEACRTIIESPWAWFLKIDHFYSYFRFLLPWVWQSVDLSGYDLVITSCSGYIARGFRTSPNTKVVAYCHTPPRWLYGYDTPTGAQKSWWGQAFMWVVGPFMRYFDYQSASRVNVWIANSKEVAKRIEKFYRKSSTVIYPPITVVKEPRNQKNIKENYYLIVSRLVGTKGILEAAHAAVKGGFTLKIVGEAVDSSLVAALTKLSKHVELIGRVNEDELAELYMRAKGFIALAHDEDFGMTVVESMAYGTPVLCYRGGGYTETVLAGKTGVFIDDTDAKSILAGIRQMEKTTWDVVSIKKWASTFGRPHFEKAIRSVVGV